MTKKDWKPLCFDPLCEVHNQPKPTTGEWIAAKIPACLQSITEHDWGLIADAHNAALVTEAVRSIESMTRVQQQVNDQAREIQQLTKQLAAAQAALGRATDATGISFDPNPLPNGRTK